MFGGEVRLIVRSPGAQVESLDLVASLTEIPANQNTNNRKFIPYKRSINIIVCRHLQEWILANEGLWLSSGNTTGGTQQTGQCDTAHSLQLFQ